MAQTKEQNIHASTAYDNSMTIVNGFRKFVILLMLLSPILQTYGWGKFNFTYIFTLVASILYVLTYGIKDVQAPRLLYIYITYGLVIHMVSAFTLRTAIPIEWIRRILLVILFYGCFDKDTAIRFYRIIAAICIIFFFFQEISYSISGTRLLGIIPFLPFAIETIDQADYMNVFESASRSSSFFSEPAHFAQFLLPLLAIELFGKNDKYKYLRILLIVITLFLLRSGNGVLGLIIIFAIFAIHSTFKRGTKIIYKILLAFFFIIGLIGTKLYLQTENGSEIAERFENVDSSGSEGSDISAFIRIFRGYYVFADYSFVEKIFGSDNPEVIRSHANKAVFAFEDDALYFNTIQDILLRTGIIGIILFGLLLVNIFRKSDIDGKATLLCLIGLMFVSSNYFSGTMFTYFLMATPFVNPNKDNDINERIKQ